MEIRIGDQSIAPRHRMSLKHAPAHPPRGEALELMKRYEPLLVELVEAAIKKAPQPRGPKTVSERALRETLAESLETLRRRLGLA